MESVLSIISNAENVRLLVYIVAVFCGYVLLNNSISRLKYSLNRRIDGVEVSIKEIKFNDLAAINKRIDGVEASVKELKFNDFAHLNSTIEALTYALEKNGSLKKEDKDYVDSRLAR